MTHKIFALMLVLLSYSSVLAQSTDEFDVYNAVIRNMFAGEARDVDTGKMPGLLVISDAFASNFSSFGKEDSAEIGNRFPTADREAIIDYCSKSSSKESLRDGFDRNLKHVLAARKEIDTFFKKDLESGWKQYYQKYPESGGFITFSHVGFDGSRTKAFLYFQHSCGSLCASGYYLTLEKKHSWSVTSRGMLWIS